MLRIGDMVKVKKGHTCDNCKGKVFRIISVNYSALYPIKAVTGDNNVEIFRPFHLERVPPNFQYLLKEINNG